MLILSCYVTADIPSALLPCCLVAWSDFFFAGIAILGRFLAQPDSPGFTGFSFSGWGGQERKKEREREREKENPVNPGLSG